LAVKVCQTENRSTVGIKSTQWKWEVEAERGSRKGKQTWHQEVEAGSRIEEWTREVKVGK
jgi:hypothetical protein